MKIKSKNRCKYYLKAHLVFTTKYRKPLLNGDLNKCLLNYIKGITINKNYNIEEINTDKNHIHILISYEPNITITSVVRYIKQKTTTYLWSNFRHILKNNYYKERTFWSDGYFVSSIGYLDENTIKNYIINQYVNIYGI